MKLDNSSQLSVFMSNSTEWLFQRLKEKITSSAGNPFFKGLIVVPDLYSKSFLQLELAKKLPSGILLGHRVESFLEAFGFVRYSTHLATAFQQQEKLHLAERLADSLALSGWKAPQEPSEADALHLFGLSTMRPDLQRFLLELSKKIPVHYYVLSPCMLFWGDICSDYEAKKIERKLQENAQEGFKEFLYDRSKLLANNATLGREFAIQLEPFQQFVEEEYVCKSWYFTDPTYAQYIRREAVSEIVPSSASLLEVIQADLLLLGPRRDKKLEIPSSDRSFQLHKAPTVIREVELLYQEIQRFLQKSTLRIGVFAPDIELYASAIKALFSHSYQILCPKSNPFLESFWLLFTLVKTTFLPMNLYRLMQCRAFRTKCAIAADDLASLAFYLEEHGLEELAEHWIIANDLTNHDASVLGVALATYRSLVKDLQPAKGKLPLADWIQLFRHLLESYFLPDDEEKIVLFRLKEAMARLAFVKLEAVTFLQVKALVEQLYNEVSAEIQGTVFAPILFTSLGQLRAASFDMVCLLGMSEGEFPRYSSKALVDFGFMHSENSVNVMGACDKGLVIEAVLSAKQALYISYRDYSYEDRCHLEPTSVVLDLLDVIKRNVYEVQCVYSHPLDSCSEGVLELVSVAKEKQLAQVVGDIPERITLQELVQSVKNPLKIYFQKGLGLYLKEYEAPISSSEFASLDKCAVRMLVKEVFFLPEEQAQRRLLQAYRTLPERLKTATVSTLQEELLLYHDNAKALEISLDQLLHIELSPFCDKAEKVAPGRWKVPALSFTIEGREIQLVGHLENLHRRGLVTFGSKSKDAIYKSLVEVCVVASCAKSVDLQATLLFVKDAKEQALEIENLQEKIKSFIEYAIECRRRPLGLYPDCVEELLNEGALPKQFMQQSGNDFIDHYRELYLATVSSQDLERAWPDWQAWARKLYGGLL